MKTIICGTGQVGSNIARELASERVDVTVVDQSVELIARIRDTLDVRAMVGHASLPDVLEAAGAADADIFKTLPYKLISMRFSKFYLLDEGAGISV